MKGLYPGLPSGRVFCLVFVLWASVLALGQVQASESSSQSQEQTAAEATKKTRTRVGRKPNRIEDPLRAAINSKHRTPTYVGRDKARHPYDTLRFFGIQPHLTVVELTPGAGWYTEILAPYLRDSGQYIGANYNPESDNAEYRKAAKILSKKIAENPELYGKAKITVFEPPHLSEVAPPETADMVLTFRNMHNWVSSGPETVDTVLANVYKSLKPGGVFGVVDHRLPADRKFDEHASSGYLPEDYVIEVIEKAGFVFDAKSEINANPKDTANHPHGVWALPPTYRNQDMGRERYEAIGESDRMTLRFIKPQASDTNSDTSPDTSRDTSTGTNSNP